MQLTTSAKIFTVVKEEGNKIWVQTLIYLSVALGLSWCQGKALILLTAHRGMVSGCAWPLTCHFRHLHSLPPSCPSQCLDVLHLLRQCQLEYFMFLVLHMPGSIFTWCIKKMYYKFISFLSHHTTFVKNFFLTKI